MSFWLKFRIIIYVELGEVAFYMKIDIDSYFLCCEIEEVTPMSTCVLP